MLPQQCFLDISGFTAMTERLMQEGKEGAEILAKIINNIFEPVINTVYSVGGFISTFAGDAFTVVFANNKELNSIAAASEIVNIFKEYGKQQTKFGDFELFVKIGLSYGTVDWGIIGTETHKAYFFRGQAVDGCAHSEHHCQKMEIVIDDRLFSLISSVKLDFTKISLSYYKINSYDSSSIKNDISDITIDLDILKMFMPDKVLQLKMLGEFREIVSVFVSFKEPSTFEGLEASVKEIISLCDNYGGYFNKIDFGDKGGIILVLFGAPVSQEKLYQRAIDFVLSLATIDNFDYRAGITAGTAFAGIVGSNIRQEYTALGNIVNLSARLMMKADWHEILISPFVQKKLPQQYQTLSKGFYQFKGFTESIEIHQLQDRLLIHKELDYSGSFIGRKSEINEIQKLISPIFENKFGGLIYIDGEAGIGKSRFINELEHAVDNCNWFYLPCDEILKKPFNPFEYFFKRYFEQSENNTTEINKSNFELNFSGLLENVSTEFQQELKRTKSVFGALVGLEWVNSLYSQLNGKGRYENTLYAIKTFFISQSAIKPSVIVIEDAHWLDADSLEMLKVLVRNVKNSPFIILVACRPQDNGEPFKLKINNELDNTSKRLLLLAFNKEMLTELLQDKLQFINIPDKTLELVWEKSEGNPFFVEQMVLYFLENKLFDETYTLTSSIKNIPSGINEIIISRVDRLSLNVQETIKTASVLGKEFVLHILEKMLKSLQSIEKQEIISGLNNIIQEQILENLTEITYIFRHALIRDVVYEMQLKSRLCKLHKLAGEVIENLYSANLMIYFSDLANHYDKAEVA